MSDTLPVPIIPLALDNRSQFPESDEPIRSPSQTPSLHEHDPGNVWNETQEQLLKGWGERSEYYTIMHDRSGKFYEKWNKWLGLPCKLLLTLISSVEFAQLSQTGDTVWSSYFVGFIALIGLFVELSQDFLDFGTKASKHFASSVAYDKLYMDIAGELTHPRDKRTNVKSFMRTVRRTLGEIKDTSLDIPSHILDQYLKEVDKTVLLPNPIIVHVPTTISETITLPAPQILIEQNPSDLQDEFAKEMERKFDQRRSHIEAYQLSRLEK